MNPDRALTELRQLVETIDELTALAHAEDDDVEAEKIYTEIGRKRTEAVDRFTELDEWLSGGGFLPYEWEKDL